MSEINIDVLDQEKFPKRPLTNFGQTAKELRAVLGFANHQLLREGHIETPKFIARVTYASRHVDYVRTEGERVVDIQLGYTKGIASYLNSKKVTGLYDIGHAISCVLAVAIQRDKENFLKTQLYMRTAEDIISLLGIGPAELQRALGEDHFREELKSFWRVYALNLQ